MSSSTPPPQQHRTPPLVSVSTSGVHNASTTSPPPPNGSTNVSSSSPLGGSTSARGHPHPHASSTAAARRPTSSSSTGANIHNGITSTSMASFGQSDTNDVVRVDDDEDMMVDGGDDERDENEETVLELALSIAVERPSTAEVVVPGIGGRPGSATSVTSSSTSPNNNNNHYSRNRSMSFTSNANNGGDSDCGEFSTMIEVGITSEQGARNTMEDRHSARLGDAKAAKHTGAGLVKSTTPHLTSSTSGAASISPSAAEKTSATSKDVNSTTSGSLPLLPPSTAAAAAEIVPLSTTSSDDDDDDDGSSCGSSSSSGVDVGPDHRGVLRTTSTTTSEQHTSQHTPPINSTGTDAHRGASPKQGTVRGGGGGVSAFHRAPSPATRRQREQEQQQERDAAEEESLRAEVEVMGEDQLAQGIPFFAVYDGHGGTRCASYLRMKLAQLVLSHPKLVTDPEVALHEAILAAEEEYLKLFGETDASGATAAVAMFIGDSLVTANVGDTEMVLCRRGEAILLSEKHTPKDNPAEKQRVIDAGGRIVHGGRVGHPRFNPNVLHVALSRAMGDAPFKLPELTLSKPSGITAIPFTHTTPIHPEDEFVIIGCDGLWDVLTYQEAVDIGRAMLLKEGKSTPAYNLAQSISDALVSKALSAGSSDNVTVLFLLYKQRPRSASHRPPSAIARHWQQHPTANTTGPSPSSSPSPALLSISSTPPSARQQ